jgi:hypothetical protein
MSMFGGWMSSSSFSSREDNYVSSLAERASETRQLNDLNSERERNRSRSRSPVNYKTPFDSDLEEEEEDEDDYISVSSSVAEERRHRRRKRNRSKSPAPAPAPRQSPPPPPPPPPPRRVEIHSTHDNAGLFNAGPYAGIPSGMAQGAPAAQGIQMPQEEPKQIAFDPFEEDFEEARRDDEEQGVDPSYCFLCIYSQTQQERERNPHYMSLLKIWYENYGKCSLLHLCTRVRDKYNERIRKRKPEKYHKYSLVTIRDHFMDHIKSQEMFHIESIRFMDKIRSIIEKKGVFTHPENNPKDINIDFKQLSAWYKVHGQLAAAYTGLGGKRSRASKSLA